MNEVEVTAAFGSTRASASTLAKRGLHRGQARRLAKIAASARYVGLRDHACAPSTTSCAGTSGGVEGRAPEYEAPRGQER